uniref:Uncharacterized protein n=1 Tax=Tolypothrix bouteillei VB521301 TaxID=1479485 RepID=A0A0C1NFA5_9CYAN
MTGKALSAELAEYSHNKLTSLSDILEKKRSSLDEEVAEHLSDQIALLFETSENATCPNEVVLEYAKARIDMSQKQIELAINIFVKLGSVAQRRV